MEKEIEESVCEGIRELCSGVQKFGTNLENACESLAEFCAMMRRVNNGLINYLIEGHRAEVSEDGKTVNCATSPPE